MDSAEKTDLDKLLDDDTDKQNPVSVHDIPPNVNIVVEQSAEEQKSNTVKKSELHEDDKETVGELRKKPTVKRKKRKL